MALDVTGNGGLALIAFGAFNILYSLLTDDEFGAVRFFEAALPGCVKVVLTP
ncbi:hypothetical protein [Shinella zoogloeoides]|uniref:hypothetical protein n=1 Tax=Shinella zoogloeoides TaxID=352475 RepID=UPI00273FFF5F|nr:hypothetical protein [Shinella zoogloeoides]WLR95432.1 hypothetical protein Q9316_24930 [Shinella zoogloeoides]